MDNLSSQQVLDSVFGRDPVLCACARQVWLTSMSNNCTITVVHKEGSSLILAHNLSCALHCKLAYQKVHNLVKVPFNISLNNIDFAV